MMEVVVWYFVLVLCTDW